MSRSRMHCQHYTIEAALLETWLFKDGFSLSAVPDVSAKLDTVLDALRVWYILSSCKNGC